MPQLVGISSWHELYSPTKLPAGARAAGLQCLAHGVRDSRAAGKPLRFIRLKETKNEID
jgi:hypothetical protein